MLKKRQGINKEQDISLLKRIFCSKNLFQDCREDKQHKTDVPKAQNTPLYCSGGYWSSYLHNEKTGAQCAPHTANLFYFKRSFHPAEQRLAADFRRGFNVLFIVICFLTVNFYNYGFRPVRAYFVYGYIKIFNLKSVALFGNTFKLLHNPAA